jgi:hypothetical protein
LTFSSKSSILKELKKIIIGVDIMNQEEYCVIKGKKGGKRVESRVLEEQIQEAVAGGHHYIEVNLNDQKND